MKRTRWILAFSLAMASVAQAQSQSQSGEVVQATPSAAAVASLNRNLALLSRSPQDANALLGAGQAALDLGDIQAANGFYTRANLVNPDLGKAKLGLAIVQIALKQPTEAAANFDAADALGEGAQGHLAERGLAYDLTGQQAKAQRDYAAALRARPTDEQARFRYAVSLGISGDVAEADKQLEPALTAGDREAWRLRAFIFAMNGRMADARKVTQSVMPKGLADALDPYMQRVSLLTPAQKAAAAHYGEFPNNVLRLAAPEPTKEREVQVAANEERASTARERRTRTTAAERRAAASSSRDSQRTPAPAAASTSISGARPDLTPPPAPVELASAMTSPPTAAVVAPVARAASASPRPASPSRELQTERQSPPRPVAVQSSSPQSQAATPRTFEAPATVQLAASEAADADAARTPPQITRAQGPADPGGAAVAAVPAPQTSSASPQARAPAPQASAPAPGFSASTQPLTGTPAPSRLALADALAALNVPEQERQRSAVAADMSAVARIQEQRRRAADASAAKAKADADAKAKADAAKKAEAERKAKLAANPARIWVQIATGRDVDALAFDLRRLRKSYSDAIGDSGGWTAEWGATRRLLVGPFKKADEARATVTKITKSGGDAFVWQSEAGEDVAKIGGK